MIAIAIVIDVCWKNPGVTSYIQAYVCGKQYIKLI
jgi:hypothetical protein